MSRQIKLFVGLGNIGEKYRNTRHNIGFLAIDEIAKSKQLEFKIWNNMLVSFYEEIDNKVCLLKPMTFMNCSGDAVYLFMKYYKIVPEEIFIFHDDFSIPIGEYRIRMSGSSGGHNGINSVISKISTENFPRMKLGVGPIPNFIKPRDYVLSEFKGADKEKIDTIKRTVVSFFDNACMFGPDKAASKIANKKWRKSQMTEERCNSEEVLKKTCQSENKMLGCPKGFVNGSCGSFFNGKCGVVKMRDCVWVLVYERLKSSGKTKEFISKYVKPKRQIFKCER